MIVKALTKYPSIHRAPLWHSRRQTSLWECSQRYRGKSSTHSITLCPNWPSTILVSLSTFIKSARLTPMAVSMRLCRDHSSLRDKNQNKDSYRWPSAQTANSVLQYRRALLTACGFGTSLITIWTRCWFKTMMWQMWVGVPAQTTSTSQLKNLRSFIFGHQKELQFAKCPCLPTARTTTLK